MSTDYRNLKKLMDEIAADERIERIIEQENTEYPLNKFETKDQYSEKGQLSRIEFLEQRIGKKLDQLSTRATSDNLEQFQGNIENLIGFSKIPTGVVGPLVVNGTSASGPYFIPLATTEGALVASYNRGCKAASLSGGIRSICMTESVQRSPLFRFRNIIELGQFLAWIVQQFEAFKQITTNSSNHALLHNFKTNIEGNQVNLIFEFSTGDAAGQNMVTFATYEICKYILASSPIQPTRWYIESNFSGDKKSNYQSFQNVRGKKVVAEVNLSRSVVENTLKSTPELMADYWQTSTVSLIQIGSIGAQGHIANGLTALFIATGQDVACISEVTVAVNRMEVTEDGGLYASLTMPNLIVGTVGGGTSLPTQKECLDIMECYGSGNGRKFAEICCALALAGELSICAAIASGHFVSAHQSLGR